MYRISLHTTKEDAAQKISAVYSINVSSNYAAAGVEQDEWHVFGYCSITTNNSSKVNMSQCNQLAHAWWHTRQASTYLATGNMQMESLLTLHGYCLHFGKVAALLQKVNNPAACLIPRQICNFQSNIVDQLNRIGVHRSLHAPSKKLRKKPNTRIRMHSTIKDAAHVVNLSAKVDKNPNTGKK